MPGSLSHNLSVGKAMVLIASVSEPPWWAFAVFFTTLLAFALYIQKYGVESLESLYHSDWAARGLGLLAIAIGAGTGYLFAYRQIREALDHHHTVTVHRGAIGGPMIFVFIGLVLVIAGRRFGKFVTTRHGLPQSRLRMVVMITGVTLCLLLEFGFDYLLRSMGYAVVR